MGWRTHFFDTICNREGTVNSQNVDSQRVDNHNYHVPDYLNRIVTMSASALRDGKDGLIVNRHDEIIRLDLQRTEYSFILRNAIANLLLYGSVSNCFACERC